MTDPTDLDELASAYLDDEVTDEERARVEADPELQARVNRLRSVSEAVRGGLAPLTDTQAAEQRRRALLAREDARPSAPTAPPVRHRHTWLPAPAVAAAVIVVLALVGAWLIAGSSSGDDADTAASQGSAEDADRAAAPQTTTTAPQGTTAAPESAAGDQASVRDLGTFASQAELTRALETLDVTTFDTTGEGSAPRNDGTLSSAVDRCDLIIEAGQAELGRRLAVATAELESRPVLVFSHPVGGTTDPAVTQLTVVDTTTCEVLFAVQR